MTSRELIDSIDFGYLEPEEAYEARIAIQRAMWLTGDAEDWRTKEILRRVKRKADRRKEKECGGKQKTS